MKTEYKHGELNNAESKGYNAYWDVIGSAVCPYESGSLLAEHWWKGWETAVYEDSLRGED